MLRSDKEITTEIPDWILTSWMEINYHAGQVCVPVFTPRPRLAVTATNSHIVTCKMEIKS